MGTALVGRDRELVEVEERMRTSRLVTLVGPGGVGKTALARATAERVGAGFAMGVRSVDLTRIEHADAVAGAVAAQLGFDSFDALLSSPSDRPLLLVVDNCEHLLDAAAHSISQVLGACRQPQVVATSRSPLELPGESVLSLAPLPVPEQGGDPLACPSVQLFLDRCRDAGASVSDGDLPAVVDLCRQLDGLPLALEIAAARARTMSVAEIANRLHASVAVLDRPRFRGDPRHRSVSDTIRWSYDLLSEGAAELFERLAVFAGPFVASKAAAVAAPDTGDVEPLLDELTHASLVVAHTGGTETRYRLLETVRRFALDRLRQRGALDATYDRFADHVQASVLAIVAGATTAWRPELLRGLMGSFDDLAEALRWCNAHDTTPHRAHTLCSVLWGIAHQGRAGDIAELARTTLDRWPDRESPTAAQCLAVLGTAEYVTGHPLRALDLVRPTIASLRSPGLASVTLRRVEGQASRALGHTDASLAPFQTGARVARDLGMASMAMELEVAAAQVLADSGQVAAAVAALEDLMAEAVAAGSTLTESWARTVHAWVLLRVDPVAARPAVEAALHEARSIAYPVAVAVNLRSLAYAQLLLGEPAAAVATAQALLDDLLDRGALSNVRILADITAVLAHHCAHPGWESLAATARALPITTLASGQFELVPLPPVTVATIGRHDIVATVRNVLGDLASAMAAGERSGRVSATEQAPAWVARRGATCEFGFGGRTVSVRSAKGVDDVIRLIEAGGREIHCLDLAGAGVEEATTGEVLDEAARRHYEQRIRELQEDIEEAERNNDHGRAYKHQVELDALIDHLTAALGSGGRTRSAGGTVERARSAVTHRVRAAIRNLDKLHPALGRHLAVSVRTGTYCSYQPEQPVSWRIDSP
jgi:predicted ATPase